MQASFAEIDQEGAPDQGIDVRPVLRFWKPGDAVGLDPGLEYQTGHDPVRRRL